MNVETLSLRIVSRNDHIMALRKHQKPKIEKCYHRMAGGKFFTEIVSTAQIGFRLEATRLRGQQQIQRQGSPQMIEINFFSERTRIGRGPPERQDAGKRRRAALVGAIRKEWHPDQVVHLRMECICGNTWRSRTAGDSRPPCGEGHARKSYVNVCSHMRMRITTATRMMSSTVKMVLNAPSIPPPGNNELICVATWCN